MEQTSARSAAFLLVLLDCFVAAQARFANHSGLDLQLALQLAQLNSVAYCHAENVVPWNCTRRAPAAHFLGPCQGLSCPVRTGSRVLPLLPVSG